MKKSRMQPSLRWRARHPTACLIRICPPSWSIRDATQSRMLHFSHDTHSLQSRHGELLVGDTHGQNKNTALMHNKKIRYDRNSSVNPPRPLPKILYLSYLDPCANNFPCRERPLPYSPPPVACNLAAKGICILAGEPTAGVGRWAALRMLL
ncbi:hypothetical protein VTO42DRAFT_8345 [Malbranchea cinnamomea]